MIFGGQNAFGIYVISKDWEYTTSFNLVFICIWVEWVIGMVQHGIGEREAEWEQSVDLINILFVKGY